MAAMPLDATTIRFGVFEADPRSGELRRSGVKVKLQEQPFQVLVALLERPGQIVTREELRGRLWPADTFVDFDHSLNAAVKRLREALGDSADNPRFVETLPRHGYRLIVPVERLESTPVVPTLPGRRRLIRYAAWALASALALALALAGSGAWRGIVGRPQSVRIKALAVLPLHNLSGNPEEDYFVDGMTEALLTELGKVPRLRVVSRQSVMRYKGTRKTAPQIARELEVDALVEGSALRSGPKVRISTQLILAVPERHLWSESYERELTDVIALQREVSEAIVGEIAGRVAVAGKGSVAPRPVNPVAYEAYLRGREHLHRFPNGLETAVRFLREAIAKDPGYAPAYGSLALAYGFLGFFQPPQEVFPVARATATKALEIDEAQSEAHAALGLVKLNHDWDWAGAEREFRRAIELNPNSPDARDRYATYLLITSQFDQAVREARRGLALDPLSAYTNLHVGWILMTARRYDEAVDQFKKTLVLEPDQGFARSCLLWCYTLKGDYTQALAGYETRGNRDTDATAAFLYGVTGRRKAALRIIENVKLLAARKYRDPYDLAIAYAGLGDADKATEQLALAYERRSAQMMAVDVEPFFDRIRSHPRFREIVVRMNFPRSRVAEEAPRGR
jgi:TolB-like protein/DNA-binding winged helix-turn-helix (wHTH) protein/Tfp pilus assembly protein PilF